MSIKQHFARWKETEAAKLRPMTAKQRAGYILHYYRFWFIGLALLLLVGFYIGDAVIQSHKEILLQGFFTNDEYNLFPAERIEKDYAATQTLTRQQRVVFDDALYIDLGGEASEYTAASNGKLTAYMMMHELDFVVTSDEVLEYYKDTFPMEDLEALLPADLREALADQLFFNTDADGKPRAALWRAPEPMQTPMSSTPIISLSRRGHPTRSRSCSSCGTVSGCKLLVICNFRFLIVLCLQQQKRTSSCEPVLFCCIRGSKVTGSLLIHVAAGHDVSTGAADVLHDHLAYMDGGVEDNAVQRGHHLGHLALGHRLGGLYRAAGMQAALGPDRAGDDAGGVGQLLFAVGNAVGAAIAGHFIIVCFIHLQVAALGAAGANYFFHIAHASSISMVSSSTGALSSRTLGRAMCSISPGARRSRLNLAMT